LALAGDEIAMAVARARMSVIKEAPSVGGPAVDRRAGGTRPLAADVVLMRVMDNFTRYTVIQLNRLRGSERFAIERRT